jgi:hypothetical protein
MDPVLLRLLQRFMRAPDGDGGAPPAAADAAASSPAAPDFLYAAAERPDFVPETFYDAEKKAIRVDALARSYGQLHSKLGERAEKAKAEALAELRKGAPEKPEDYAWTPDGSKVPEFAKALVPADTDPAVVAARQVLHRLGAKSEDYAAIMDGFMASQLAAIPDPAAEKAKLGDGAGQRIQHVEAWLNKSLGAELAGALAGVVGQAEVFLAVEKLSQMFDASAGGVSGLPGGGSQQKSWDDISQVMAQPAYRHPTPEGDKLREEVRAWFAAGGKRPGKG